MIRQMSNNKQCEKKKILKSKAAVASNTSAFEFWITQTDSYWFLNTYSIDFCYFCRSKLFSKDSCWELKLTQTDFSFKPIQIYF